MTTAPDATPDAASPGNAAWADGSARRALLAWYDANKRDLPWRRVTDPYAIWVSEIMLQQTRVDTVIPYYERFLRAFPDAHALAAADEDAVLARWSGLGYYRRARLLHRGVREVVERYGGAVPEDADARRALPGVGRYTAGAIGSIAFSREEPVVDGNVARVLCRVDGIETPLGRADTERALWARASQLVAGPRPGDLNQAVMELGARVCTVKSPACETCPLATGCVARAQGRVTELPSPKLKKPKVDHVLCAVVATRGDRVALVRSTEALFGGLFGPPMSEGRGRTAATEALRSAGIAARLQATPRGRLVHVLTHRRLDVEIWRASAARLETTTTPETRLVARDEVEDIGTSTLTRKILAASS